MRIFIHHDDQGNIASYFIPAKQLADQVELVASEGQSVSAVEAADIKEISAAEGAGADRGQRLAAVATALQRHKVDVRSKKLVAK